MNEENFNVTLLKHIALYIKKIPYLYANMEYMYTVYKIYSKAIYQILSLGKHRTSYSRINVCT